MDKSRISPYRALFTTFLKASAFTFGGGLAIIRAIEMDLVEKYGLLSKDEFLEYATLSQTMPGVIALNCAALVGRHSAGTAGMLVAGFGAILPTFFLMVIATTLVKIIPQQGPLIGAMRGIRAASAALVVCAAVSLGKHNIKTAFSIVLMLASFTLAVSGSLDAPMIIVLAGAVGLIYQRITRHKEGRRNDVS